MLEHVHHQAPVTALAFSDNDLIFAGEGHLLCAYDVKTQHSLASLRVFRQQAIHGLLVYDSESPCIITWGDCLVRSVTWLRNEHGGLRLEPGPILRTTDWILDASFSPSGEEPDRELLVFVTAHNALVITDLVALAGHADSDSHHLLIPLIPGSNCLLYCAHVTWLSPSHCLIASGTAFGDVTVWSATLSYLEAGALTASAQTHYTFSAHEGSVFGVQMSPPLSPDALGGCKRGLATCSDDRMIRVWDVSDFGTERLGISQAHRGTGYSAIAEPEASAPRCWAKVMGHMSRIWHVRFLPSRVEEAQGVDMMSFGEDASAILWHLQTLSSSSNASTHILQQYHIDTAHAGKHIWSVAISPSGYIATGGSNGAIAVRTSTFGNPPSLPLEIGSPLLGDFSGADTFKAYSFIAPSTVIATTTQGKLIVLKLQAAEIPRIWELASSLSGLRGYSVVTSLPDIGTGWAAGLDGKVYMYVHEHRRLTQVFDAGHKVAGLFAHSRQGHRAIALLVTGVGGVDPTLLLLAPAMAENVNLMPVLQREIRLALAHDFVVTSFSIITRQKGHDYAVLGSRNGDIALYNIDVAAGVSAVHAHLQPQAHSKEAVTSLHWVRGDEPPASSSGFLHSTGRDGRHAVHSLHSTNGKWSAELVHCLALPFGPNLEGVSLRPDNHIWIWGFKGKHFVAYDTTAQQEVMTVECGGGHRSWAFQPEAEGGWFVWTGKAQLYQQQQTQLPYVLINPNGHGREIKALAVSPIEKQIIATGAEDTNIKLWTFSSEEHGEFRCMQTLRKHNTGIQHLQWSRDGRYLFSSGGFEEFCIWRVQPDLPGMVAGVVCESMHPNSGASDLRIMGFEVRERSKIHDQAGGSFEVHMAYSDSTLKRWHYEFPRKKWSLVSQGEYLTACLTHVFAPTTDFIEQWLATAATDGHVALWNGRQADREGGDELQWTHRHKVHQNAILSVATNSLPDATTLVITGGDDNGIGITRLTQSGGMDTLLMPRVHAAAVTGLIILHSSGGRLTFASAGIDQRLKLWRVTVNIEQSGIDGVEIECLKSDFTAVADVSSLTSYRLADGTKGVLVAGVGMDLWGVQA